MDRRFLIVVIGTIIIVAIYLGYEHRVHVLGNTQYLLFALFIGLHFVMHLGHGKHDKSSKKGACH